MKFFRKFHLHDPSLALILETKAFIKLQGYSHSLDIYLEDIYSFRATNKAEFVDNCAAIRALPNVSKLTLEGRINNHLIQKEFKNIQELCHFMMTNFAINIPPDDNIPLRLLK